MTKYKVQLIHEISMAHRLVTHSGNCRRIHGHNYVIGIEVESQFDEEALNDRGMVIYFSSIEAMLCHWLDDHWDHRLMLWVRDPLANQDFVRQVEDHAGDSLVFVPFNPTAENMAGYLVDIIFPSILRNEKQKVIVSSVTIHETSKAKASAIKELSR